MIRRRDMSERYEERFEYAPDGSCLRHSEVHVGAPNRPGLGGGITLPGGILQQETVLADRRYIGPFTFNADTLERVDFPGGFFDHAGRAFYMVRDWNSSVAMVVDADGEIRQHTGYYPYGEPWAEPEGQLYLYAGKERMRFLSKGDSDFGPRAYNAAMAQWWAPDALASETPWFSPYTYCGANPNRYSDLSGFEFSTYEQLLIAKAAYKDEREDAIKLLTDLGITVSTDFSNVPRETFNGFSSILFERSLNNGGKEYAYSFSGTEPLNLMDWSENIHQLSGTSIHYLQAVVIGTILSSLISDKDELCFIGHSKGGGAATAASMATGHPAYTFNPAAVSPATSFILRLGPADNVTNYIAKGSEVFSINVKLFNNTYNISLNAFGDMVYNLQKNILHLTPPGKCIFFPTTDKFSHAIGTFESIPYFQQSK